MTDPKNIRNFAIVAHIDHGKSTLADRILELTGTIDKRNMMDQVLDSNPIERERGITIKLAPVAIKHTYQNKEYLLNLIDTPGHVDFSYEVSRSLAACEGIVLIVDATKGIQAQTLSHFNLIKKHKLKVIPVVNKIDLPAANTELVKKQLVESFKFEESEIICISAKTGVNVGEVISAIIERIPAPTGNSEEVRALVFSSHYDSHLGVVVYIRLKGGKILKDENSSNLKNLKFCATGAIFRPIEIGVFTPEKKPQDRLNTGEVGYIATGLKDIKLAQIGDTIIEHGSGAAALPGFTVPTPFVFFSLYPTDNDDYLNLRNGLEKLQLSDSSITVKPSSSPSLGKGFLCGFLGLLHADVTKERLYREFSLNLVATVPTVEYQVKLKTGNTLSVRSPEEYPEPSLIEEIREPVMSAQIFAPSQYLGNIMQLCQDKRAIFIDLKYFGDQAQLNYLIPLSEMITDFFDRIKSISSGYASLDYELYSHEKVDAVKMDVLINHDPATAFSQIVVRENSYKIATKLVARLKDLIPKHQFQIAIQAAIGGKIIARSDISAYRKDVTAKLYGGDRTRKDKLLEAQRKGKKKMRFIGRVEIPQEVFLKVHSNN